MMTKKTEGLNILQVIELKNGSKFITKLKFIFEVLTEALLGPLAKLK